MDNLTHTLFGLTLARTRLGRTGRGATAALVLASNAPDVDFVAVAGGTLKYLEWHRGPTHGLIGMVGLGLAAASIVRLSLRARDARNSDSHASFRSLWLVSMLGILFHILMDVPTSYGTRFLSPFDWHWFAEDWLPIVDVYLLTILAAGLWFGGRQPSSTVAVATAATSAARTARARSAAVTLLLVAMNYGLRATAHHEALAQAPQLFGPLLPQPCAHAPLPERSIDRWPHEGETAAAIEPSRRCLVEIAAMPSFLSPFRWRLIARLSDAYELHDIDVLAGRVGDARTRGEGFWRRSRRYPNVWTPAVLEAASSPVAQTFLGFSRFPAARSFVDPEGRATVRWTDVRFTTDDLGIGRGGRNDLFTVTVRISAEGRIEQATLGP